MSNVKWEGGTCYMLEEDGHQPLSYIVADDKLEATIIALRRWGLISGYCLDNVGPFHPDMVDDNHPPYMAIRKYDDGMVALEKRVNQAGSSSLQMYFYEK